MRMDQIHHGLLVARGYRLYELVVMIDGTLHTLERVVVMRPIKRVADAGMVYQQSIQADRPCPHRPHVLRSEEHTSELQSLMRISYAVFCLKKKTYKREP